MIVVIRAKNRYNGHSFKGLRKTLRRLSAQRMRSKQSSRKRQTALTFLKFCV